MRCILVLLLLWACDVWAWGRTGHRVVGELAEQWVQPNTRQHIRRLLGRESLAKASLWADRMKSHPEKDFLRPWHYVQVPEGGPIPPITDQTTHILEAIELMVDILQGTREHPDITPAEALKLLVHFVGDVHQPLHVSRPWDRGGTRLKVSFFGRVGNLHWVWDSAIVDWYQLSYHEWVEELRDIYDDESDEWLDTSSTEWAQESLDWHPVVYNFADRKLDMTLDEMRAQGTSADEVLDLYPDALMALLVRSDDDQAFTGPPPAGARIPRVHYYYIDRALPIVQETLYRGGRRLAHLLDSIW